MENINLFIVANAFKNIYLVYINVKYVFVTIINDYFSFTFKPRTVELKDNSTDFQQALYCKTTH